MVSQFVAGVCEFNFDVLDDFVGICRGQFVEFRLGKFFGVAPTAFCLVEANKSGVMNSQAKAFGRWFCAVKSNFAKGRARGEQIEDFIELHRSEILQETIRTHFHDGGVS